MKRLDWYIARRYLGARKKGRLLSVITWIALGGVTVGVAALVVVIAVMTGMQKDLKAKILGSTPHVMVQQYGAALRMTDWRSAMEIVRSDPDVVAVRPFILSEVIIRRGDYNQPATLYGVATDTAAPPAVDIELDVIRGLGNASSGLRPILLGSGLAENMQVFSGDTLILASFENITVQVFGGLVPAIRQFEVTDLFTTGMYEYDNSNVYTSVEHAQDLLGLTASDEVTGLFVRTSDPEKADVIGQRLDQRLNQARPGTYFVGNWMVTNRDLFAALKLEKLGMGLILFLIVLVAAFNIVSTLVMVVADRTREIGILKAMGMTDRGILRVFILQGAWIGVVGTGLGTAFGLALCWLLDTYPIIQIPPEVYFIDRLPVSLDVLDLVVIMAASILIAFAATIYPSLQAARLQPVEAIRHE